ncbi:MAG: ferritin family protein [Ktedonobacterales bacterium]
MLYARHAGDHGEPAVADLFEQPAQTELLEHFAQESTLTGFARSDTANLRDAIAGESYEAETMYQQFEEDARADGDVAAARFAEVRQDKQRHRKAFVAMLARLESVVAVRKQ